MATWRCQDCPASYGAWLSRCPRCRSAKELLVALNACTSCTTKFAVGLKRCPHCGSAEFVEDGQPMAKITAHGGPSDKTLPDEAAGPDPLSALEEDAAAVEVEPAAEEAEGSLPGDDSPAPAEESEAAPEPGPDYEALTVEELKAELSERGLPKSGKRDDLARRLQQDDSARTTEAE